SGSDSGGVDAAPEKLSVNWFNHEVGDEVWRRQ
ncbi:hypothetical protein A2U01_0106693, partial [Trifolium medium]|nr:hypothetical protein [Trifolium medium]